MAEGEEFASEMVTYFAEDIVETGNIVNLHEVAYNALGGIESEHGFIAVVARGSSRTRAPRPFS